MAVISADTFDPLRRYVRVRLQQGVPIVDADVNEREDIQKFELRAFLQWFVGDGVPDGNDGFRIVGTAQANDFEIRSGISGTADALSRIGRCLVRGLDVMIDADLLFSGQGLHEGKGPAADALAAKLGVPKIAALATPTADGAVVAFLDVWERLVTPAEDPALVLAGLGTESCARVKREWVVRARAGSGVPAPGDADFLAGHAYLALATLQRRAGDQLVQPGDVSDRRERRLLLPPATLIEDVLGTDPADYRAGRGRPPVSLREAINALLRGELPSTPDAAVDTSTALDVMKRAALLDDTGGLVAVWFSDRVASVEQVFASRLDLADVAAGFVLPPQQVTAGAAAHVEPHAVLLPGGDLLVAYQAGIGAASDVSMKRAVLNGLGAAAEVPVAATAGVTEASPFLTVTGNLATVFFHLSTTDRWQYRRWRHTTSTWVDTGGPVELSTTTTTVRDFHAAVDPAATVWAAFRAGADIQALQLDPATGAVANEVTHDSGNPDQQPFVLCTASGDVWVLWQSTVGLHAARFRAGAWEGVQPIPGTGANDRQPSAVEDATGGIWLFWSRGAVGAGDLFAMRRDPATGAWGAARQLTISTGDDSGPFALVAPDAAIWILWSSDRDGNVNTYYKRLVTAL
jgi:Family of unknown function (DUF6519)